LKAPFADVRGQLRIAEDDDSGTPTASLRGRILEGHDLRVFGEERPNDTSLNPLAPAVNDAYLAEPRLETLLEVLFHNAGYVPWSKRMEVDVIFEWKDDRFAEWRLCLYDFG